MRAFLFSLAAAALTACTPPTHQHSAAAPAAPAASTLEIRDAWAPPTPGGVDISAGYVTIVNGTSADDQLVGASSPRAQRVELHEMTMDGNVMRMSRVDTLAIAAHGEIALAPHGQHLMFFGVTQPFVQGERIPVTLTFARAGQVNAELDVRIGGH